MVLCETSVRERAYYIWEGEGRGFGRAEAHWLQAETELRQVEAQASVPVEAVQIEAVPAKVAKPRAARAKAPAKSPADVLAGVAKAAKSIGKAPAKSVEKAAAKAVKAAPKAKPVSSRAKPRGGAEAAVLH